jgi:two-component SAPR family response regulator
LWEGEDFKDATDELYAAVSEARRWLVDALAGEGEAIPAVSTSGRSLILQKTGQGYRLTTELVSVDVSHFEHAFAAAKAQPDSPEVLRAVIHAYDGDLLDYADNPDAFTWFEREGLRVVQQKKAREKQRCENWRQGIWAIRDVSGWDRILVWRSRPCHADRAQAGRVN